MSTGNLQLSLIRLDGDTQARMGDYTNVIEDYARAMKVQIGAELPQRFPPIVVFHDGSDYWLADGFHRVKAALSVGLREFAADIREGDKRAALLWAIGSNTEHGMQRTNADKRNAVKMMLQDKEWCGWSDSQIATHVAVHQTTVSGIRSDLYPSTQENLKSDMRTGKDGRTINVSNIGKKPRVEVPKQESLPYAELCARCQRVGSAKGCRTCQEMLDAKEATRGQETANDPVQEEVQPDHVVDVPKQDAVPAASSRFDWDAFHFNVESLRMHVDALGHSHGMDGVDTDERASLLARLEDWRADFIAWNNKLTKENAA